MAKTKWLGDVLGRKPGALHRQLGIPKGTKIPKTLLTTIQDADAGDVIANPTKVGRRRYRVSTLLQRRVNPVLTASRSQRRRRRRGRIIY